MKSYVFSFIIMGSLFVNAQATKPTNYVAIKAQHSEKKLNSKYFSYNEWKNYMVQRADQKLKSTQLLIARKRTAASSVDPNSKNSLKEQQAGLSTEIKNLNLQAEKESFQLGMSHDLTISDYFVGYLTKQSDVKLAIQEISGKMTSAEISELMQAYANNFFPISQQNSAKPASRTGFDRRQFP